MADKYIYNNGGTLTEKSGTTSSSGAADAGKIIALDATGRIDVTMMPAGFGDDAVNIVASETLAAGDFVNVWNDAGTPKVRKADATTAGKHAHGFVLAGVSIGASAKVFFEGTNTQLSGLTAGDRFLSTTAGQTIATAPSASGNVVQKLGVAVSATAINVEIQQHIVLA